MKDSSGSAIMKLARISSAMFILSLLFLGGNAFALESSMNDWTVPFKDPHNVLPSKPTARNSETDQDSNINDCADLLGSSSELRLSLQESVRIAVCQSPQVRSTWANVLIKASELGMIRAESFPNITMSFALSSDSISYPGSTIIQNSTIDSTTSSFGVSWRILDFGKIKSSQLSSAKQLKAAIEDHNYEVQKLVMSVINLHLEAQAALAFLNSRKRLESFALQTQETTLKKESLYVASNADILQASAALAKMSIARIRAAAEYKRVFGELLNLIQLPNEGKTEILIEDILPTGDGRSDLSQSLAFVKLNHPAVRAARYQWEAAVEGLNVAISGALPTLDFDVNYYENGRPNQRLSPTKSQETLASLTFKIPIFEGFKNTYQVRSAQAKLDQSLSNLIMTENQVQSSLLKLNFEFDSANESLSVSERHFSIAVAAEKSLQRKFIAGAASISDLLELQSVLEDADIERVKTLINWRSSKLRLLTFLGLIDGRLSPFLE